MACKLRRLRIVVLKCYTPSAKLVASYGDLDDWFRVLFTGAVERHAAKTSHCISLEVTGYNVVSGEYPGGLDDVDAVVVTGSGNGAYEPIEWIQTLEKYIQNTYSHYPLVKLFGACFGHQIISKALLADQGVYVERNPHGWENGVHTVNVCPEFTDLFPEQLPLSLGRPCRLSVQFVHSDHVVIPETADISGWVGFGATELCSTQGLYKPCRVLTYQGHAEYDIKINTANMEFLAEKSGWSEEYMAETMSLVSHDDDSAIFADVALAFFLR